MVLALIFLVVAIVIPLQLWYQCKKLQVEKSILQIRCLFYGIKSWYICIKLLAKTQSIAFRVSQFGGKT